MAKNYNHNINAQIAYTHLFSKKKQTLVAAFGVTIGIAIFIFMNSLMHGFEVYSIESLFKSTPHLRIYKEEKISQPLVADSANNLAILANPKITKENKRLINPNLIIETLKKQPGVIGVTPNVSANVFYNNGEAQVIGRTSGVNIEEQNTMFHLENYIVEGKYSDLKSNQNGIIIGVSIAQKLNVRLNDNISVATAYGVSKVMKVVALLRTGVSNTDKTLSYTNISAAQQLNKQGANYITDIFVNIKDFETAKKVLPEFKQLSGYEVEDWETANASASASNKIRKMMAMAISLSIMLVAGFGIYNILNMTIIEKLNDIAILKAIGFSGKDVIKIFVKEAMIIGIIGIAFGLILALILVKLMGNMWVGGDIGFFPIRFFPTFFASGIGLGLLITTLSGYIPARKAAKLDPITIFRK
ncbi:ABC transporter permease [Flavobacterium psychrophilum]|uniref:Lipoprotein releasing system transmembrane protein LolC n=6 Tax=Flavobacterium psychrophilum TaxID=96345 RepID=A6GY44_FLAPJ|nr:FtsX-like permease family protein [Flavobacterium psychrophilum]AIG29739.1 membrane protein [Flavobacterium psychrophilum]AIG32016.1 membrane protein [Flavobacterium psychrophilum]AIG34171.1 membrane protein [Flavobacterium psychrophilum]AIG36534.1 membrane protein [Flavobacterium psychrophilum]AIG38799.1 membrane protein [Flavobacterium psychrophilum]